MGHPPIPATLVQPTFRTFSCKTWRTVYMRNKNVGLSRRVTLLAWSSFCEGWVTLLGGPTFLLINTFGLASRVNSVKERWSEHARVLLAQGKGVPYFGINGLSMILCLWSPLHPLTKLLMIQDHAQNLEEQLWMGGRREVSVISHRPVTSSDLKHERSFFRGSVSTFLQLVVSTFLEWIEPNFLSHGATL